MNILSLMKRMSFIAVLVIQEMVISRISLCQLQIILLLLSLKLRLHIVLIMTYGQIFQFHNYWLVHVKMVISTHIQSDFKLLLMQKYGFSNQQFYYIFLFLISAQFIVHIENKTIAFQSAFANNVWIGTQSVNGEVVLVSLISNIIMEWEHIL